MFENLKAGVSGAPLLEAPVRASYSETINNPAETDRIVVLDNLVRDALAGP